MSENTITQEQIDSIIEQSSFEVFHRVHEKQCLVVAKLPNGFTVVGESACVDPNNYDEQIGYDLAVNNIKRRLWELEGYALQNKLHSSKSLSGVTADFIEQVEKCNFKDDHGHVLQMNKSYIDLFNLLQS